MLAGETASAFNSDVRKASAPVAATSAVRCVNSVYPTQTRMSTNAAIEAECRRRPAAPCAPHDARTSAAARRCRLSVENIVQRASARSGEGSAVPPRRRMNTQMSTLIKTATWARNSL